MAKKYSRFTDDMKYTILMERAHGKSGRIIAEELPVSHATVYSYLQSLPDCGTQDKIMKPALDDATIKKILYLYVYDKQTVSVISKATGVDTKQIFRLFKFVKQTKRSAGHMYPRYPELSAWMTENGYSATFLANQIGISKADMLGILTGSRGRMTMEIALKIQGISNLPLNTILKRSSKLPPPKRRKAAAEVRGSNSEKGANTAAATEPTRTQGRCSA